MRLHRFRSAAVLTLTIHTVGCATWRPVPREAGLRMLEEGSVAKVQLSTADGRTFETVRPVAQNDSLVFDNGARRLAYDEVIAVAVRETDHLLTLGVIVGLPLLLALWALGEATEDCTALCS